MGSLNDVREALKKQLAEDDANNVIPTHDCFEVEDLNVHSNHSFSLDRESNTVSMYDTSRNAGNRYTTSFGPEKFPFDCKTAVDHYTYLYRKALRGEGNVMFIGYVDPKHFKPIAPSNGNDQPIISDDSFSVETAG